MEGLIGVPGTVGGALRMNAGAYGMQIGSYVQHRLEIAGSGARVLFEPECMAEILRYTGGTPQLINTLCDSAMMLAEAHNVQRVGIVELRDATQELNWVEFSARPTAAAAVAPHAAPTESADSLAQIQGLFCLVRRA